MEQRTNRIALFSAERWRASQDLRADIAYVVVALAILAGISAIDTDARPRSTPTETVSATR